MIVFYWLYTFVYPWSLLKLCCFRIFIFSFLFNFIFWFFFSLFELSIFIKIKNWLCLIKIAVCRQDLRKWMRFTSEKYIKSPYKSMNIWPLGLFHLRYQILNILRLVLWHVFYEKYFWLQLSIIELEDLIFTFFI